jgi:sn-glycerol 3-phosphate transport system substrate-binding protein
MKRNLLKAAAAAASLFLLGAPTWAQKPVELTFYYPIAVGGPLNKVIDQFATDFEAENPGVKVKPIYAGTYQETLIKSMTAAKSGTPPTMAVLLSGDIFTLIGQGAIVPVTDLAKGAEDAKWLDSFYPAFMLNSRTGGKTWSVPFQRSTIVQYWNKDLFKEAGLDPEKGPANWGQLVEMSKKLTKTDARGNVMQWGVKIPSTGFQYWMLGGLAATNGATLANADGTVTSFDDPAVVEALQYWVDLSAKHKVMPAGVVEWGTTPKDFLEKKAAIIWTTTGNLTNIRANAQFPFGVAMLPANKRLGSPTGGGNLYFFKNSSPEQLQAAVKFAKFLTEPKRAGAWSVATGYVAVSPAAWETPEMKKYANDVPAATVARGQLQHAVAELSTHDGQRVIKALNDAIQASLTGSKPAAESLKEAQREATRILKPFQ